LFFPIGGLQLSTPGLSGASVNATIPLSVRDEIEEENEDENEHRSIQNS